MNKYKIYIINFILTVGILYHLKPIP